MSFTSSRKAVLCISACCGDDYEKGIGVDLAHLADHIMLVCLILSYALFTMSYRFPKCQMYLEQERATYMPVNPEIAKPQVHGYHDTILSNRREPASGNSCRMSLIAPYVGKSEVLAALGGLDDASCNAVDGT